MVFLIQLLAFFSLLGLMAFLFVAMYHRSFARRSTIRCPHCHEAIKLEEPPGPARANQAAG